VPPTPFPQVGCRIEAGCAGYSVDTTGSWICYMLKARWSKIFVRKQVVKISIAHN